MGEGVGGEVGSDGETGVGVVGVGEGAVVGVVDEGDAGAQAPGNRANSSMVTNIQSLRFFISVTVPYEVLNSGLGRIRTYDQAVMSRPLCH